mgnify:CR=1 FL=1
MATSKEIRNRIGSVQNTKKITRTMELVSTAKAKKAVDKVVASRPYADKIKELIGSLAAQGEVADHPLLRRHNHLRKVLIVVVTAVLLAAFWFIVQKTPLGRAQRACEQDAKMAALLGVDVNRTIAATFVIGAALAAVAGVLYLLYYGVVNAADGFVPGVKAFTAAVLGGIGSIPGAVIGGLLIGLIETFWSAYFSADYKDVAAFSILAVTLIFMPSGLLGRPEVEKV